MKIVEASEPSQIYELSTGKYLTEDQILTMLDGYEGDNLSAAEKIEIADYFIELWENFKRTL